MFSGKFTDIFTKQVYFPETFQTIQLYRELSSMHNSLPLNASNAIFICMDETRCDMLKAII